MRSASIAADRDGRRGADRELDVARTADTTALVLVPESGDSIQTLKAGVMEVADVFVVNKADRPGADRLRNDVEFMLGLRKGVSSRAAVPPTTVLISSAEPITVGREAAADGRARRRGRRRCCSAVATRAEGSPSFVAALDRHFAYLEHPERCATRRRERLARARHGRGRAKDPWPAVEGSRHECSGCDAQLPGARASD